MNQHAFEFDTSVAAEGFRQVQIANEHPFSQEQHEAWLKQFLSNARKVFGLPDQPKSAISEFAQELEQLGYFGFAHYIRAHATCGEGCGLLRQNQMSSCADDQRIF
ncbi:MAG TPA: hypothetical protein VK460_09685 [Burkholderiales bacterium]|nr:hypothetical protein [Burkholderiales bacterium]